MVSTISVCANYSLESIQICAFASSTACPLFVHIAERLYPNVYVLPYEVIPVLSLSLSVSLKVTLAAPHRFLCLSRPPLRDLKQINASEQAP